MEKSASYRKEPALRLHGGLMMSLFFDRRVTRSVDCMEVPGEV